MSDGIESLGWRHGQTAMDYNNKKLEHIIKTAYVTVKKADIKEESFRLEAFKYALNHLWSESKEISKPNAKK